MGKYTQYGNAIDQQIQKHIDIAVDELKKIPGVESVVIVGGFGRGEGSVRIEGNKIVPINDYDVYVLTSKKINEKTLNTTAKKIEGKLGSSGYSLHEHSKKSFYFDVRPLSIKKLPKLAPMIKYYEMKHASILAYGKDYRNLIKIKKEDLPPSEALRFLFTRMSHLIEWFPVDVVKGEKIPDWKRETLLYDISKTYLACCTALCMMNNIFEPTYLGRMQALKKVFKNTEISKTHPELMNKIEYYTNLKLKPEFGNPDLLETWKEARLYSLAVAEVYLRHFFDSDLTNFYKKTTATYFKPYLKRYPLGSLLNFPAQVYLRKKWFLRILLFRKKFHFPLYLGWRDPGLNLLSAVPYLLNAADTYDQKSLKTAYSIIHSVYPVKMEIEPDLETFDRLRKAYADAWRLYFFQKIG